MDWATLCVTISQTHLVTLSLAHPFHLHFEVTKKIIRKRPTEVGRQKNAAQKQLFPGDDFIFMPSQGCQMVYFQTKNPHLGKFWSALDLGKADIFYDHL
jgi:RNase P protein component